MNEAASWLEYPILGAVLLLCLLYIYRNLKKLFFPDPTQNSGGGCGGCSSNSSCSTAAQPDAVTDPHDNTDCESKL